MDVLNADMAGELSALPTSLQAMALVLIKSNSVGFCVQISSQNREAIVPHQISEP